MQGPAIVGRPVGAGKIFGQSILIFEDALTFRIKLKQPRYFAEDIAVALLIAFAQLFAKLHSRLHSIGVNLRDVADSDRRHFDHSDFFDCGLVMMVGGTRTCAKRMNV